MKIINNFVRTCCETAADIDRPFGNIEFEIGEIYLFHKTDPNCPDDDALWAVFGAATQTASCSSRAPTI